jgi:hypothetical protein
LTFVSIFIITIASESVTHMLQTNQREQWRCVIAGDSDALSVADAAVINENIYLSDLDSESRKSFEMAMHDRVARAHVLPSPAPSSSSTEDTGAVVCAHIAPRDANLINSTWLAPVAEALPPPSCHIRFSHEEVAATCGTLHMTAPAPDNTASWHAALEASSASLSPASAAVPAAEAALQASAASVQAAFDSQASSTQLPTRDAFDAFQLEPEVKALAMSLYDLELGLKKDCVDYATGLALQGVLTLDHLRRVSELEAWKIIKSVGLKVIPQQALMEEVFGKSVVDPDGGYGNQDKSVPSVPPREQVVEAKNILKARMDEQRLRIQNDQSEPLTDEQREKLHPEVQAM